jgi:3-hydroxy-9,10-secoandrosta-1,3,5(10)-triene-9,17-dione monooxygenase reductase component
MSIDPAYYREVLSFFPTGVTVVTGIDGERPIGFTIGSFTSVSLDPPLVGFLPMKESDRWGDIHRSGSFCVNVLNSAQGALCWQFAKSTIEEPFEGVGWSPSPTTGSPVLDDALAWIDCAIEHVVEAGDHWFVMGRVIEMAHTAAEAPDPLLFFCGRLGHFDAI